MLLDTIILPCFFFSTFELRDGWCFYLVKLFFELYQMRLFFCPCVAVYCSLISLVYFLSHCEIAIPSIMTEFKGLLINHSKEHISWIYSIFNYCTFFVFNIMFSLSHRFLLTIKTKYESMGVRHAHTEINIHAAKGVMCFTLWNLLYYFFHTIIQHQSTSVLGMTLVLYQWVSSTSTCTFNICFFKGAFLAAMSTIYWCFGHHIR